MIEKNIEKMLDILKNSENNLIQAEYIFDELRKYIADKKEVYKKVLENYNQDELNRIIQLSYKGYVKRAQKLFLKEVIYFVIWMFLVTIISSFVFHVNSDILLMIIIASGSIFFILRSVIFKKNLENETKELVKKEVDKNVLDFVEGLKR